MKRIIVLASLPVMLLALTKVNLIRNAGFEQAECLWLLELSSFQLPNTAEGSTHDDEDSWSGDYSAFGDTRIAPEWNEYNTGVNFTIHQEFVTPKTLADIDSISWRQRIMFKDDDYHKGEACMIAVRYLQGTMLADSGIGYGFMKPGYTFLDGWVDVSRNFVAGDTEWLYYEHSLIEDFGWRFGMDTVHFSEFVFYGYGWWLPGWAGQKIRLDDIRLPGWADYDIALTRITGELATPSVIVWNNGREDLDKVKVVVTITDSGSVAFVDTVSLSLDSDDSTEVVFESWTPAPHTKYSMTFCTGNMAGMLMDECDENDFVTQEYNSCIDEDISRNLSSLEIMPSLGSVIKIRLSGSKTSGIERVIIFDASGRKVDEIAVPQARGLVSWGEGQTPGVYFIRIGPNASSSTQKVVLTR